MIRMQCDSIDCILVSNNCEQEAHDTWDSDIERMDVACERT